MIKNIIKELQDIDKKMEKELEQLRYEKSQTEAILAFLVKNAGEIELNLKELLIQCADINKIKIKELDTGVIKLYYESE